MDTITDDFCDAFKEDKDYKDAFALLVAVAPLPLGVDPADERVQAIVKRCRETLADQPQGE